MTDLSLIHILPISNIGRTKAQLSAKILEARKKEYDDEWDIAFVPTLNLKKYAYVMEWFSQHKNYKEDLTTVVSGVEHTLSLIHISDDSFRAWDKVRTEYLSTIRRLLVLPYNLSLIHI